LDLATAGFPQDALSEEVTDVVLDVGVQFLFEYV
jgi:hypothetical protein